MEPDKAAQITQFMLAMDKAIMIAGSIAWANLKVKDEVKEECAELESAKIRMIRILET